MDQPVACALEATDARMRLRADADLATLTASVPAAAVTVLDSFIAFATS